jgi:hypothetical protein
MHAERIRAERKEDVGATLVVAPSSVRKPGDHKGRPYSGNVGGRCVCAALSAACAPKPPASGIARP